MMNSLSFGSNAAQGRLVEVPCRFMYIVKCLKGKKQKAKEHKEDPFVLGIMSIYHDCLVSVITLSKDGHHDQARIGGGQKNVKANRRRRKNVDKVLPRGRRRSISSKVG